ncbi:MAG: N-acetylmuramoyl-L-alanine amidase [Acidobacteriia bacterium]|nr:N-acetylmuramoyl-L-alanine amidase [Terriglobia bacterium]
MKLIAQRTLRQRALLLALLLAFPAFCFPSVSAERRERAIATFNRALRMRTTLQSRPESKRTKADYEKVIRTFREVYQLNPAYSKAPVALSTIAELEEEMGRVFSSDRYYLDSVKAYGFLIDQYPYHRLAGDALFTIAEIYRSDLEDPEAARQSFRKYLEKYPHSEKAGEARKKLKEIEQMLAARNASQGTPPTVEIETRRSGGLPEVTAIRHWVGPNYTRIVIGTEGEVKFDTSRLRNPDRIVLDLQNTRLSPALVGKTFPVENGFLRQVRVAQFSPTVTRVVLDVEKIEDYSVIPLPNPFRLVVDIHGVTETTTAKAETPPSGLRRAPADETPRQTAHNLPASRPGSKQKAEPEPEAADENAPAITKSGKPAKSGAPQPVETATAKPPADTEEASSGKPDTGKTEVAEAKPPKSAAPTEAGSRTLTRALGLKIGRIVIDPGHGGHDTGTIGPSGLREKDVVLDVGLRLRKLLEQKVGCEVVMTRSDDTFIPLEERTAIANEKAADLFVSIHANASRDRSARGIETYYLNFTSNPDALEVAARENATSQESVHQLQDLIKKIAMTEKITESQDFAHQIQRDLYRRIIKVGGQQRDRGVKKAPFVVLIGANMPSILAEISFLTNPRDERLLRKPDYRQKIAEALYQGVVDYVNTLGGVKVAQRAQAPGTSSATPPQF